MHPVVVVTQQQFSNVRPAGSGRHRGDDGGPRRATACAVSRPERCPPGSHITDRRGRITRLRLPRVPCVRWMLGNMPVASLTGLCCLTGWCRLRSRCPHRRSPYPPGVGATARRRRDVGHYPRGVPGRTLTATSDGAGAGAAFTISLPPAVLPRDQARQASFGSPGRAAGCAWRTVRCPSHSARSPAGPPTMIGCQHSLSRDGCPNPMCPGQTSVPRPLGGPPGLRYGGTQVIGSQDRWPCPLRARRRRLKQQAKQFGNKR